MIRHLSALVVAAFVALAVSGDARAASVTFVGTFQENLLAGDDLSFSFMSDDSSVFVTSVTLNLNDDLEFDPPFAAQAGAAATGFDGMFQLDDSMPQLVTLNFGDFGSGETFRFRVDVDPGLIRGAEFAGSIASFTLNTGETFSGAFVRQGLFSARVRIDAETQGQVPEPASMTLLGLGLSGLALRLRPRGLRRRG